jgi:hypothetical protein
MFDPPDRDSQPLAATFFPGSAEAAKFGRRDRLAIVAASKIQ